MGIDKNDPIKDYLKNLMPEKNNPDDASNKIKINAGGDYIGRDQYHEVNHIHATSSRLLTRDERRTLHNLVKQLEDEYGESGRKTWKSIHNILGVDNIEVMHLEHYKPTEAILQLLIENAQIRLNADDDVVRTQLDQSASALTKLTERNADLSANLMKYQQAFANLDVRYKKQTADLQSVETDLKRSQNETKYAFVQNKEAKAIIAATRRRLLFSFFVIGLSVLGAIFWGYKSHAFARNTPQLEVSRSICEFGGKPYTIGSILDNTNAPDVECVASTKGQSPQWQAIKQKNYVRKK